MGAAPVSATTVTTSSTTTETRDLGFDGFASEQLYEGYDRNPSCVRMVQLSTGGAIGDAFNAEGVQGFFDLTSDVMLWKCRGGTFMGYVLFRLVTFAVIGAVLHQLLSPVFVQWSQKRRDRMRVAYANPCTGTLEACRIPSGEVCFRDSETSPTRCMYTTTQKTGEHSSRTEYFSAEVDSRAELERFLDRYYPETPWWATLIVAVLLGGIVSSLINFFWRWYAKSQVMRPEALGVEAFARTMF